MLNECEVYLKSITSELGINYNYNYNYNYNSLVISDHMGGFDITLNNEILDMINNKPINSQRCQHRSIIHRM